MSLSLASTGSTVLKGMGLAVLAYTLFAVHDAMVKSVVQVLPVVQILFVRSLVITAICLVLRPRVIGETFRSPNKPMLALRALLTLAAWTMYYSTGRELQLAEMTTLYYFAPVITIVLAVVFLKERLSLARAGAAGIGFFGVVVACDPAGVSVGWPQLLVLGAAFSWAVAMILMRSISKSESSMVLIFSINLLYVPAMGLASIWAFAPMSATQLAVVAGTGIVAGVAQFTLIEAARRAPASVVGTAEYGALVWSFIFGWLFWNEQPAFTVFVGAAMVIAAGLTLAWSEHRARRVPVAAA